MIEEWLARLEAESKALKQSFDRIATDMTVYTKTSSIATTANTLTFVTSSGTYTNPDQERLVVTFDTADGSNTIPKLEYTCDSPSLPVIRQAPHNGGARWIITNNPNYGGGGGRIPTNYGFTVQSLIDGTLSVAEASS